MGEGIQAFADYFEIVPGSNLVTEHLDCMTPTGPACPVWAQLASAPSSRTGVGRGTPGQGQRAQVWIRVCTGTFLTHTLRSVLGTVSHPSGHWIGSLKHFISRLPPTSPYPSCDGNHNPMPDTSSPEDAPPCNAPQPLLLPPASEAPQPFSRDLPPPTELHPHPCQVHILPQRLRDSKQSSAWCTLASPRGFQSLTQFFSHSPSSDRKDKPLQLPHCHRFVSKVSPARFTNTIAACRVIYIWATTVQPWHEVIPLSTSSN